MPLDTLRRRGRAVRRAVLRRRRPLAALCAAVAVAAALSATSAGAPPTVPVTVAARALPAGTVLDGADLSVAQFTASSAPADLVAQPTGQVLAAPLARGEPITGVRLVGPALAAGHPGRVAVPVRLPDAGMVELLEVGDALDLVATDPQRGSASTVAVGAPVLALPGRDDLAAGSGSLPGRLVVLGLSGAEVSTVSSAAVAQFLTFTWSAEAATR